MDFQMYLLVKFQQDQQVSVNLREINNEPGSLRTGNQLRLVRQTDWGSFTCARAASVYAKTVRVTASCELKALMIHT